MSDGRSGAPCSRRGFLNGGAAFVAGGIIGGATGMASAASRLPSVATTELPWPWVKIDPMEAGRRSFHNYHEKGG